MVSLDMFQEQFRNLKEAERGKDQLIENLIIRVKELEDGLTEEKLHLEREQETTKAFQSRLHDANVKLKKRDEEIDSNSFVSVLIDGDCMTFLDHFVKSAQQGGLEAVRRLWSTVCEYVLTELKLPTNIQIRIRVYANTKGLASAYCYNKILDHTDNVHMFVRGFNMGHPMCDFVDAGDGKECADSKLKAWFNHDLSDVQCQAVMFGGSADNGYARLLQPYVGDNSKSNRIVLIEGPPFAKELAGLANKFLVARFYNVFRNTKLSSRQVSFSMSPPSTPIPNASSYATTIATSIGAAPVRADDAYRSSTTVPARRDYSVLQNSRGQRLDAIISPSPTLVNVLRNKKQCNAFHILGECHYSNCSFLHGARLDEKAIEARRWIARQAPCLLGLQCRDEKCLLGHQCPERACAKIGKGCRFTREMHSVDRT